MYNDPNFFGYNPMFYAQTQAAPKLGLLSKLKNGINWSNLLNNTSKTINVINQAIPLVYQIKPLFQNAKTMFKIADIIRTDDKPKQRTNKTYYNQTKKNSIRQISNKKEEVLSSSTINNNQPTFFL